MVKCPDCGTVNVSLHQTRPRKTGGVSYRYKCHNPKCETNTFSVDEDDRPTADPEVAEFNKTSGPELDENSPSALPTCEVDGNTAHMNVPREGIPPTLEVLFNKFHIIADEWEPLNFKINEWQQHSNEFGVVPLYQGKVTLVRKNPVVCEWPTVQPVRMPPVQMKRSRKPSSALKRTFVVSDAHVGFFRDFDNYNIHTLHDLQAFACVTAAIIDSQPDTLVLLGDMLDLPDWSDHFVQSPEFSFSTQMSINWLASWIHYVAPYCGEIVFVEGNHEARLDRNIITNTASAHKLKPANLPEAPPLLSIRSMLGLDELGVKWVGAYPTGEHWVNSNLRLIHGKKLGGKSGQTVMKLLDGIRASVLQGHSHRSEMAHITTYPHQKVVTYGAYSVGTLARLDGMVPSANGDKENWQQGIAIIDHNDEIFNVDPIQIYGGRMIADRKLYDCGDVTNDPLPDAEVRAIIGGNAHIEMLANLD